jgi:hypothetical protein
LKKTLQNCPKLDFKGQLYSCEQKKVKIIERIFINNRGFLETKRIPVNIDHSTQKGLNLKFPGLFSIQQGKPLTHIHRVME